MIEPLKSHLENPPSRESSSLAFENLTPTGALTILDVEKLVASMKNQLPHEQLVQLQYLLAEAKTIQKFKLKGRTWKYRGGK